MVTGDLIKVQPTFTQQKLGWIQLSRDPESD